MISKGLSAWCLVLRGSKLVHASVEYVGRGKFKVNEEYPRQAVILGKTVDASEILSWNLVPR